MSSFLSSSVLRISFLVLLVVALVSTTRGHEQKTALTDISYNERTGNLEVAHRFRLHDAEHTLRRAMNRQEDLTQSTEAQSTFADYVADRFALKREDGSLVPLTLVGQELDGGYLWVYQEAEILHPFRSSFFIRNTILLDVVQGQVNTVNVRFRTGVSTFVFKAGSGERRFEGPFFNQAP